MHYAVDYINYNVFSKVLYLARHRSGEAVADFGLVRPCVCELEQ